MTSARMRPWVQLGGGAWWKYIRPEAPCWKGELHLVTLVFIWERATSARTTEQRGER